MGNARQGKPQGHSHAGPSKNTVNNRSMRSSPVWQPCHGDGVRLFTAFGF
ncbi:hypothetical protein NAC44_04275 [Allorhizobium sp. BGMRC 0089]|nr:hypothetical protein [Allorhizobium sonneratiae]MCM2291543.1 hypothetical protein [Allorhizobium sonneratiae]